MFGESESESPRTGSPWDGFLSKSDPNSPIIEPTNTPQLLPKLVPEVEEVSLLVWEHMRERQLTSVFTGKC